MTDDLTELKQIADIVAAAIGPQLPQRDYRKELWIATYQAVLTCPRVYSRTAVEMADIAVATFDKTFR